MAHFQQSSVALKNLLLKLSNKIRSYSTHICWIWHCQQPLSAVCLPGCSKFSTVWYLMCTFCLGLVSQLFMLLLQFCFCNWHQKVNQHQSSGIAIMVHTCTATHVVGASTSKGVSIFSLAEKYLRKQTVFQLCHLRRCPQVLLSRLYGCVHV